MNEVANKKESANVALMLDKEITKRVAEAILDTGLATNNAEIPINPNTGEMDRWTAQNQLQSMLESLLSEEIRRVARAEIRHLLVTSVNNIDAGI